MAFVATAGVGVGGGALVGEGDGEAEGGGAGAALALGDSLGSPPVHADKAVKAVINAATNRAFLFMVVPSTHDSGVPQHLWYDNLSHMDDATASVLSQIPPGTLIERLGIEVTEVSAARAVGTMPVEGNTQPYGLLHGGATAALAETLGSLAAMVHATPDGIAVGVDLNITHHRAARAGSVTGVATQIYAGRTVATYAIEITGEDGKPVSTARLTCAIRPRA